VIFTFLELIILILSCSKVEEQPNIKQRKLNDGTTLAISNEDNSDKRIVSSDDKNRIAELEAQLQEKDELLKRLEMQLQQQKIEENWKKRVKEELINVYRQLALYEQTKAREKVAQDILRLGQVTLERYTFIELNC
jgi:predicted enzyme involved in methoxymalonyl-ACP biosynthesis